MLKHVIRVATSTLQKLMILYEMQLLFGVGLCVRRMGFGVVKLKGFG
jgi:hypothetical protein